MLDFSSLLIRVLLTLGYVDQFSYPLTAVEIFQRLIGPPSSSPADLSTVRLALKKLQELGLVKSWHQYYFLSSSQFTATTRLNRQQLAADKWQEVSDCVALLKKIPWIKAIFVTGSLAMDNVVEHDDIDFLVITQVNRIWLARLAVWLITIAKHKRRTWKEGGQDTWCFNMWLEETGLRVPNSSRNLYTAYELFQAKCVFDRGQIAAKFKTDNQWANKYLVNFFSNQEKLLFPTIDHPQIWWQQGWEGLWDLINRVVFGAQWLYMRPHMTIERVGLHQALFHPRHTKKLIFYQWQQSLKRLK